MDMVFVELPLASVQRMVLEQCSLCDDCELWSEYLVWSQREGMYVPRSGTKMAAGDVALAAAGLCVMNGQDQYVHRRVTLCGSCSVGS